MQMKHDEEFSKAFMADDEAGATPADVDPVDPAAAEEAAATAADPAAVGDEAQGNGPTDDAAEGAAETPAAAVVIAEGDDDSDVPAEDMQAFKSWRGRLKKREEELAAREAALAQGAKAPAADEPVALKDGGEVDELKQTGDGEPSSVEIETEHYDDGSSATGVAELPEQSPDEQDADAILASFAEDYGPEFVAGIERLVDKRARALIEQMGGEFASGIDAKIEQVVKMAGQNMGRMHSDVLLALREDAQEIAESPEFQAWIDGLEGDDKANAERVVNSGNLREVLGLFKQYDGAKGPAEKTPEDIWAEDAAAGVKGSAPLKLPTRAPANAEDEYKRAWDAM